MFKKNLIHFKILKAVCSSSYILKIHDNKKENLTNNPNSLVHVSKTR